MKTLLLIVCFHSVFSQSSWPESPSSYVSGAGSAIQSLTFEKDEIKLIRQKNSYLREKTKLLKERCDKTFSRYDLFYNELLKKVKDHPQGLEQLEINVEIVNEWDTKIERFIEEIKGYIRVFYLKKIVLQEDIGILESRSRYFEQCKEYGSYINFEPAEEVIGARSLKKSISISVSGIRKSVQRMHEKSQQIQLDLRREEEIYQNSELRNNYMFSAASCKRRLNSIKKLIGHVWQYSVEEGFSELKYTYKEVLRGLNNKTSLLKGLKSELHEIIVSIKELQMKYDRLSDVATCFRRLAEWQISTFTLRVEKTMYKLEGEYEQTMQQLSEESKIHTENWVKSPDTVLGDNTHFQTSISSGEEEHF